MEFKQFDYVRLTLTDINGCHLSKLVKAEDWEEILHNECQIFGGVLLFGPRCQDCDFDCIKLRKTENACIAADKETLSSTPWASKALNYKVCSIICDLVYPDGEYVPAQARLVAKKQIDELESMGFRILSGTEPEFRVFDKTTLKPVSKGPDIYKTSLLVQYQSFFMEAVKELSEAKIIVDSCSNENGSGQLEMPLKPRFGIQAADEGIVFKQAIKEIANNHDMKCSFMTVPILEEAASANHFNHSIWKSDRNVLMDLDGNLSDFGLNWIGGIMHHMKALCALYCPTVNCYRRIGKKFIAPKYLDWDFNSRFASFRVKGADGTKQNLYFEVRPPSSASCPYHVLAGTVAAGIDGVKRKLKPLENGSKELGTFPSTLDEALCHLENDKILVEALGHQFVQHFVAVKRLCDIKTVSAAKDEKEAFEIEREQYFDYI